MNVDSAYRSPLLHDFIDSLRCRQILVEGLREPLPDALLKSKAQAKVGGQDSEPWPQSRFVPFSQVQGQAKVIRGLRRLGGVKWISEAELTTGRLASGEG